MEIYQLRTFVAVAQQGHLTQAAEILHLSQPAVTAQIKALEEETGVSLFERTASGVMLTEAGKLLLPEAERILATSREMLNKARALHGELSAKLKIGTITNSGMLRLGDWLALLRQRYPLLSVVTMQGISGTVLNDVRKKELDAGFYFGKNPYQNVNCLVLRQLDFRVIIPVSWSELLPAGDWKALGRATWLGISQFSSLHKINSEVCREHNINPKRYGEFDQEYTMVDLVRAGLGVSIVTDDTAQQAARRGEVAIWGEVVHRDPLMFIYSADKEDDLLLKALKETIVESWGLPTA